MVLKGIFSGLGALIIAFVRHESLPGLRYAAIALVLGFASYGLSIFLYVRTQNIIGAAKTRAYYAVAPFIGAFLSFIFLHEKLTWIYLIALAIMAAGASVTVTDTLIRSHEHEHQHTYTHFHDGHMHTHTIVHSHVHDHYASETKHGHHHSSKEFEKVHISHR